MMFKNSWRNLSISLCICAGLCSVFAMDRKTDLDDPGLGKPILNLIEWENENPLTLDDWYNFGVSSEQKGKFSDAAKYYQHAAVRGHRDAQYSLATLYTTLYSNKSIIDRWQVWKAIRYCRLVIQQGDRDAHYADTCYINAHYHHGVMTSLFYKNVQASLFLKLTARKGHINAPEILFQLIEKKNL